MKRPWTPAPSSPLIGRRLTAPAATPDALPPLTTTQQAFVDEGVSFVNLNPMFFTGRAGTGKTVLIKAITARLTQMNVAFHVTASTGIASVDISGSTFASFMSWKIDGNLPDRAWIDANRERIPAQPILDELLAGADMVEEKCQELSPSGKDARTKKEKDSAGYTLRRFRDARLLIVDEVSTLDAQTWDNADALLQYIRGSTRPFGGLKVLLFGDCLQLPPTPREFQRWRLTDDNYCFLFQSRAWQRANSVVRVLKEVHRQSDPVFVRILSEIRFGIVTPETEALLQGRVLPPPTDGQPITFLYPHVADADNMNKQKLGELTDRARVFTGVEDTQGLYQPFLGLRAEMTITLKTNAQVMLLRNMRRADLDLVGCHVPGGGAAIDNSDPRARNKAASEVILANGSVGRIIRFERTPTGTDSADSESLEWPVVRFVRPNGAGTLDVRVEPYRWSKTEKRAGGAKTATRIQVPLLLSYAISSHKSQGLTITGAVVACIGKAFSFGQVYVMLSRVRTLSQLYLTDFDPSKVTAHPAAVAFYKACEGVVE